MKLLLCTFLIVTFHTLACLCDLVEQCDDGGEDLFVDQNYEIPIGVDSYDRTSYSSDSVARSVTCVPNTNTRLWENNNVTYFFSDSYDAEHIAQIELAMDMVKNISCVEFTQVASTFVPAINITNIMDGCYSTVGAPLATSTSKLNIQNSTVGTSCNLAFKLVHELFHSCGCNHLHNRYDRDDFLIVHTENIQDAHIRDFNIRPYCSPCDRCYAQLSPGFDYESIMMYQPRAFSKNGLPTLEAKNASDPSFAMAGQRTHFSASDIAALNCLLSCPSANTTTTTTTTTSTTSTTSTTTVKPSTTKRVCRKPFPILCLLD